MRLFYAQKEEHERQHSDQHHRAINALFTTKDYSNMKFIIEHTDDEIKAAYEKMGGVSSPQSDGMPHAHNPHAVEDRMIKGIEEIDILQIGRASCRERVLRLV